MSISDQRTGMCWDGAGESDADYRQPYTGLEPLSPGARACCNVLIATFITGIAGIGYMIHRVTKKYEEGYVPAYAEPRLRPEDIARLEQERRKAAEEYRIQRMHNAQCKRDEAGQIVRELETAKSVDALVTVLASHPRFYEDTVGSNRWPEHLSHWLHDYSMTYTYEFDKESMARYASSQFEHHDTGMVTFAGCLHWQDSDYCGEFTRFCEDIAERLDKSINNDNFNRALLIIMVGREAAEDMHRSAEQLRAIEQECEQLRKR
ncbi:hypothetical protein HY642_04110 [Candidatus Woesearchaeota archaeon]|nr:hypothetical protein [Candidatus Woesearchaeota archaeon]